MSFRFVFLIFFFFVLVHCGSDNDSIRRQFGGNNIPTKSSRQNENYNSNQFAFNEGSRFSNSEGINKDSNGVKEEEGATRPVTETLHSLERGTGDSFGGGNNFDRPQESSTRHSNTNQITGSGGQSFGSRPGETLSQFSRNKDGERYPSSQSSIGGPYKEFGSGQPIEESTNNKQQTDIRPTNEGNNFSGRPAEGSAFGQSSGRPSGGSTFGQSSGRPAEGSAFGHSSGRPAEGSAFGHSSGRPAEGSAFGHSSGRPAEGSAFGQSSGRPAEGSAFGQSSGRPAEGSTFGQSTGRPSGGSTFGHSSGRPAEGSAFGQSSGRPAEGSAFGHSSGRPSEGLLFGQTGGFRPSNEGHSSGRPHGESGFGQLNSHTHEGQMGSGTQRPGLNEVSENSQTGDRPEGESNKGVEDGKEDDKDVCFTHLGCFKMGKPWKSTLRPVGAPHAPEKIQTVIHFYSRQNPKQPENITVYPQVNMGRAHFDPQKISAIIVHGFSNSGNATWMKEMKDVYLRKVDANVMIVDWGKGAQLLNYLQVAGNTRVVGKQLGAFVDYLIKKHGADPGRFHLIGHSLGAQICSYLAKDVPGIARLTALDPAQPGFEGFSKEVRLDQTDAEFVDVIHTDARPFIPTLGFGMMAPHGHVDFYMNGGFDQPGCVPPPKKDLPSIKSFLDFAKFPVEAIAKAVACPHARAYEYLIEAFNETDNCIFWGHKTDVKNVFKTVTNTVTQGLFKKFTALSTTCSKDDCIPLGFATKKSPLRGAFVVTTSGRSPYCISEKGVPPETLPKDRKRKSAFQKIKEGTFLG